MRTVVESENKTVLTAVFLTFRTFSSLAADAWIFLCSRSTRLIK